MVSLRNAPVPETEARIALSQNGYITHLAKHAATAVLALPNLANEISATKSPIEFAHARNVNPIIAVGIFQNTPRAVKRPTISFASQAIQSIAVIIPKAV